MLKSILSKTSALKRFTRSFNRDNRGVAAIEFALIAPVMIFMYFGLAESAAVIDSDRNVSHTASVVGDLITQTGAVDSSEVEDVMSAAIAVMGLRSQDLPRLKVEIRSYSLDASDNLQEIGIATMSGSQVAGAGATFDTTNIASNRRLITQSSGLVVARVFFKHEFITTKYVSSPTLSETFLLKPRRTPTVPFQNTAGGGTNSFSCSASGSGLDITVSCS